MGLNFLKMYLESEEIRQFLSLEGFDRRRHTVPSVWSAVSEAWAQELELARIEKEMQILYESAKAELGLKRSQIKKQYDLQESFLECEHFQYLVKVRQLQQSPDRFSVLRQIRLGEPLFQLGKTGIHDYLDSYTELVIPLEGHWDFEEWADRFEELAAKRKGVFNDREREEEIEYFEGKLLLLLSIKKRELRLRSSQIPGIALWKQAHELKLLLPDLR